MFGVGSNQDDEDWHKRAECYVRREEVKAINKLLGYDMFYPDKGKTEEAIKWSKKFCGPCTEKLPCLTEALDNGEAGTWGNETFRTRKRLGLLRNIDLSKLQKQQPEQLQDESMDHNEVSGPDPSA